MRMRAIALVTVVAALGCRREHGKSTIAPIATSTSKPILRSKPLLRRSFESRDGRFVVEFPCAKPPHEHHSEVGRRIHAFDCVPFDGAHFEVLYFGHPEQVVEKNIFEAEVRSAPEGVVRVRAHRVGEHPAQSIDVRDPSQDWGGTFMAVLSRERQYDVLAYGPGVSPDGAIVREFVESFRILH